MIPCVLIVVKISELNELAEREARLREFKNSVANFVKEIKTRPFSYLKSEKKIFAKNQDLKKVVERISRKLQLKKVSIKRSSARESKEIKIAANQEGKIYNFIKETLLETPGVTQFKTITFLPTKNEIVATLQFKILTFSEPSGIISIKPTDRKFGKINLFNQKKSRRLFCAIDNSKAYVNDSWFQIGDPIGDYRLINVDQNSIEIQGDNGLTTRIKLGDAW
jgi:hypothetical protein